MGNKPGGTYFCPMPKNQTPALCLLHGHLLRWVQGCLLAAAVTSVGCAGSSTYKPEKKYAPAALRTDWKVLRQTYERCHPSLFWYSSQATIDSAFDALETTLTDSMTELAFKQRLAQTIALIHCGHTSIGGSKAAKRYKPSQLPPQFPLQAKVWQGDSMVVVANAHRTDSLLVRGTVLTAINGRSVQQILDTLCGFISADGLHRNFKYQLLSSNFAAWYKTVFGLSESYVIEFLDAKGQAARTTLLNYNPAATDTSTVKVKRLATAKPPAKPTKLPKSNRLLALRRLSIDTARSLAIMQLSSFSGGQLPRFFRQSFKTMRQMGLKHLAIELRDNGGGNIANNIRLTKYLSQKPFKVADTVAANSLAYPYPLSVRQGLAYQIQRLLVGTRRADGRIHYRAYENRIYNPKKRHHFSGQVYIINGGLTFSASILFQWPLIGQANVLTVGEETGGGWYGNSAVNTPTVVLPHTKLRARLPLYRLVINQNEAYKGRGVLPMVPVPPSSWHLRQRLDPKMVEVYRRVDSCNAGLRKG
ncbi:MAG: hypothetical protein EAY75_11630 [Bacteroidetes bacterium]|nr:MAG: hypothetical protein EAY75_11630 [Bacteroidota bacterium]